jgi:hypothetical protein
LGERRLRRWLTEDSAFRAEYEAARSAMFQVGMSRIQALAGRVVETLEDLLGAKQYPAVRPGRRTWCRDRDAARADDVPTGVLDSRLSALPRNAKEFGIRHAQANES